MDKWMDNKQRAPWADRECDKKKSRAAPSYTEAVATPIMVGITKKKYFISIDCSELSVCVSRGQPREKSLTD